MKKASLWDVGATLLVGLIAALAVARGAPAPLPRPRATTHLVNNLVHADFVGEWVMLWEGEDCPTILGKDGSYTCRWRGGDYVGWWRFEHGQFEVTEAALVNPLVPPDPDQFWTWQVRFERERGLLDRRHLRGPARLHSSAIQFELKRKK